MDLLSQIVADRYATVQGYVANRLGKDCADVDDITQETFLDFIHYLNSGEFKCQSKETTVLFSIMRRRLMDYYRQKGDAKRLNQLFLEGNLVNNGSSSFMDTFEQEQLKELLLEGRLTHRQKAIVKLILDDVPLGSIGVIMSIGQWTLRKELQRLGGMITMLTTATTPSVVPSSLSPKEKARWLTKFVRAYVQAAKRRGRWNEALHVDVLLAVRSIYASIEKEHTELKLHGDKIQEISSSGGVGV